MTQPTAGRNIGKNATKTIKRNRIGEKPMNLFMHDLFTCRLTDSKSIKIPNRFPFWSLTKVTASFLAASLLLAGCTSNSTTQNDSQTLAQASSATVAQSSEAGNDLDSQELKATIFSLVSSAENSTTDYEKEYSYIEDIGDGRGYTCGLIGFTSGTGDLLDVVNTYVKLRPDHNPLAPWIPALEKVNGTDSHAGLGPDFEKAWKQACQDPEMKTAQNEVIDRMYYDPALRYTRQDGLPPLGLYIYYDALVVHGPGDDPDSFGGIRQAALENATPPSQGGDLTTWLHAFLDARTAVMKEEAAHSDLSRIEVQEQFIREGKWDLKRPLHWKMYGDSFSLE